MPKFELTADEASTLWLALGFAVGGMVKEECPDLAKTVYAIAQKMIAQSEAPGVDEALLAAKQMGSRGGAG